MKHNAFTALSMAAALVVAGSAEASEFSMDFETGTALPGTEGTWTVPSGDASAVVATPSGAPNDCGTQVLSLDTGDDELNYAPTSTDVSILTMDVCFVGADSVPDTTGFTGQTMVYLDVSDAQNPALKAYVGTGWQTISTAVTDGSWHTLKMTFDYANDTVKFKVGTEDETTAYNLPATASQTAKVAQVGFKGTGMVDNFVGDKAGIPAYVDNNVNATATYDNGSVSVTFSGYEGTIQYIEVEDSTGKKVYLRGDNATALINVSKLNGNIRSVKAHTQGSLATSCGVTPSASAVAVDTTGSKPQISITVPNLVSGLYYTPVAPDGTVLAASQLIAPADDGDSTTFTVPASTDDWDVVKFKIVASDEALTNN